MLQFIFDQVEVQDLFLNDLPQNLQLLRKTEQ
jgi:hypothetical protein